MDFSIITPSFRNSDWLRLCVASVHDQQGVTLEHIVQDAGSDDGTLDWLLKDTRVKAYAEKDAGMYDAVNRGLRKSSGDLLAYLNCDEQYLPGALQAVKSYFHSHPEIVIAFADMVVVDETGKFMCYRKVLEPRRAHIQVSALPIYTCSMFFRRSLIEKHGIFFDPKWRDLGDVIFVLELLKKGIPMGILRHFTSSFTDSGENMNLKPNALREAALVRSAAPAWVRHNRRLLELHHRLRRWSQGNYSQAPFDYSIYTLTSPTRRINHRVTQPTFRWVRRVPPPPAPVKVPQ